MTTLEIILTLTVALLYALGTHQGGVIAEEVNKYVAQTYGSEYEIDGTHKFLLVWLWPVATIKVLLQKDEEND